MSINKIQGLVNTLSLSGVGAAGAPTATTAPTANVQDVKWFSAALDAPGSEFPVSVSDKVINGLTNSSKELQRLSDQAAGDLLKASKSLDAKTIIQANRSLSSFYLQSMLTAKIVSKGTQAVERLTNLQ
ncbi:MAG: type III secretion system inner rod subunit SctI [Exilibacterium sp.]